MWYCFMYDSALNFHIKQHKGVVGGACVTLKNLRGYKCDTIN